MYVFDTCDILSSPACDVHVRLKTTAGKTITKKKETA